MSQNEVRFRDAFFQLFLFDKFRIWLNGQVMVGAYMVGRYRASEIYAFKCPLHGYVANYVKGFEQRLECPICNRPQVTNDFIEPLEVPKFFKSRPIPFTIDHIRSKSEPEEGNDHVD